MRSSSQKTTFMTKDSSITANLLQISDHNTLYATFFATMINKGLIVLQKELFKPIIELSESLLKHRITSDESVVLKWISAFLRINLVRDQLLESLFNSLTNIPENSLILLTETITQSPLDKVLFVEKSHILIIFYRQKISIDFLRLSLKWLATHKMKMLLT